MAAKRKSGPSGYKPEHEATRGTTAVLLRVAPEIAETFAAIADEDGVTKAETFAALVTNERARRDRRAVPSA